MAPPGQPLPHPRKTRVGVRRFWGVFTYTSRALRLVWSTNRRLTTALIGISLLLGLLPAAVAYVGKLVIDTVLLAVQEPTGPLWQQGPRVEALGLVALELVLVVAMMAAQRGLSVSEALLRVQLGQAVNELILRKAIDLPLAEFERAELYDKITRAQREASYRPLSLVRRALKMSEDAVALVAYTGLLVTYSGWLLLLLGVASLPSFLAEARFNADAFRLFRWRAPEERLRRYLETVLGREDHVKEVKLFQLGEPFLERYRRIFAELYARDRSLTLRRGISGFACGAIAATALAGAYAWVAWSAMDGIITVGAMTMLMVVLKQAQSRTSSLLMSVAGMYDDNLYVTTLYELLEHPVAKRRGSATRGPEPGDGLRFEQVSFTYPGAANPALDGVTLHVPPGTKLAVVGMNGSGKTTLVKLLTRLYAPSQGRVMLDGCDLEEWDATALHHRMGVIFQDFVRYQLRVGENIGVGDVTALEDEVRWAQAAEQGLAAEHIAQLPEGYHTQLGRWFGRGQELSLGQWQRVALARAFMRRDADILVLDEPTASLDAAAEAEIYDRFRELSGERMAILVSHRFSTVRLADQIIVLEAGRIVEHGTHDDLLRDGGRYAELFRLQAAQYC